MSVGRVTAASAVANWTEESNGRIEARVFELAEPLDTDAVPTALLGLGLECLHGIGKKAAFSVFACPPSDIWPVLFVAASTGGAYNHGSFGAYGRLAASQSLACLSGAADGAPRRGRSAFTGLQLVRLRRRYDGGSRASPGTSAWPPSPRTAAV